MLKLFRRTAAVAMALAVGASCGDEDLVFPGGPPGPAADIALTSSDLTVVVGVAAEFGASAIDEAGNRTTTAPTVASCDNSVVSVSSGTATDKWATVSNITGAGLGETCLTVSAGGLVDTVEVITGPAGLVVSGPDTVGSGEQVQYSLTAVDASGGALTGSTTYDWVSSSTARFGVDETGLVSGRGTGTATIRVRAPGGADATKSIVIAPGVFAGTLSLTTASGGAVVTASPGAGDPAYDNDMTVSLGTTAAWIESISADAIMFAVPATGTAGAQTLSIFNIGPDQWAQTATFTNPSATGDAYQPANLSTCGGCTLPAAPSVTAIMTANNNVYFAHGGYGTGSASRGAWNGGGLPAPDHYFRVVTGAAAAAVTMTLQWTNGSDVDIFVIDAGGTEVANGFSGSSTNEIVTFTFPANTTHYVGASMWDAGSDITNFRFNFGGL